MPLVGQMPVKSTRQQPLEAISCAVQSVNSSSVP
jgi:hypothetical protein